MAFAHLEGRNSTATLCGHSWRIEKELEPYPVVCIARLKFSFGP
jgi:hypothetical protein